LSRTQNWARILLDHSGQKELAMTLQASIEVAHAPAARRAMGALIFGFFGSVLLEVWDSRANAGLPLAMIIAVLGLALFATAGLRYRRHAPALVGEADTPEKLRADRVFNIVNVGQWVLILVLGNVMANLGWADWVVPMAIVVIGLHFLPLAQVYRNPSHYVTAFAMVAFAVSYPLLAPGGARDPIGFFGTGLILWASAAWALRPARSIASAALTP
jgi:hypothetical protein